MPDFDPWASGREPLLEDERPYRDAKRGITIPAIKFREPDPLEDDEITARYLEYRRKFIAKKQPGRNGNGNQQPQSAAAQSGPPPLYGNQPDPPKANPFAPKQIPQGAFDALPPEARAGMAAGAAAKSGGPALYACKDGTARRLSENALSSVAMLEVMYQPDPADPKPYTFDGWLAFHLNHDDAYQRMVTVCAFLRKGLEPPPVGEELKQEWQEVLLREEDTDSPPVEGAEAPDMQASPSSSATHTPIPTSTEMPPSIPSQPASEVAANGSATSEDYSVLSPGLQAAMSAAAARVGT